MLRSVFAVRVPLGLVRRPALLLAAALGPVAAACSNYGAEPVENTDAVDDAGSPLERPWLDGDGVGPGCDGFRSGMRLEANGLLGEDGSWIRQPGWFDTEHEVHCELGLSTDGQVRCLPTGEGVNPVTAFADPACTVVVAFAVTNECDPSPDPPPPRFARVDSAAGDDAAEGAPSLPTSTIFEVTDSLGPLGTVYGMNDQGECAAFRREGEAFAGEEVPPSEFVPLVSVETVGDRLQLHRYEMDDGATGYSARDPRDSGGRADTPLDGATGEHCKATFASDGSVRCAPFIGDTGGDQFSTEGCDEPVAPGRLVEAVAEFGACGVRRRNTRLQAQYFSWSDGLTTWLEGRVWDTELEAWCAPDLATDGVLRCLPLLEGDTSHPLYADDGCTQPIAVTYECADHPLTGGYVKASALGCDEGRTVHPRIGRALELMYVPAASGCTGSEWPEQTLYEIGEAVPPETFVGLTSAH